MRKRSSSRSTGFVMNPSAPSIRASLRSLDSEEEVKNMLIKLVPSYKSNSKIVDHFYEQQSNSKNDLHSPKIINDENKVIRIKSK